MREYQHTLFDKDAPQSLPPREERQGPAAEQIGGVWEQNRTFNQSLLSNANAQRKLFARCLEQARREGRVNDMSYIEALVQKHLQGSVQRRERKIRKGMVTLFQSPDTTSRSQ